MFGIAVTFVFGIVNFVMHRAVMESAHPLLQEMPWSRSAKGKRVAFMLEFGVLLSAMLLVANGWPAVAWAYAGYTLLNGLGAWMLLRR